MKRVLHVVHTMECGGIETMLMNIYRRIDKSMVQFDFLVNGKKENYYTPEIERLGGQVLNVTPKRESLFRNIQETISIMKNYEYDVVHIHQDSMISFGIMCAKIAGIKKIFVHAHTTSSDGIHRKIMASISRPYIRRNATVKFACSDAAAHYIYGKKETEYLLFKNAIDAQKLRYNEGKTLIYKKNAGVLESDFIIGTCGRLSREKNQVFLIDIFAEIKKTKQNAKLLLVGDGEERPKLIERAKKLGVEDDLIITGIVSNVEQYYRIMDVFILPSFYEGLPLAGIEAQAAGIPCFFSTGITRELEITNNVMFISLERDCRYWCDTILENVKNRCDTFESINRAGYDIGDNVLKLQKMYCE